jgi:DNA replication protein DnaC
MTDKELLDLAKSLRIHSLDHRLDEIRSDQSFYKHVSRFLEIENEERNARRLERCVKYTGLKRFEPLANFDWTWPKKINERQIRELFELDFLEEKANVVFLGPNGTGKTMLLKNLVHAAACNGVAAHFVESATMLHDLVHQTHRSSLEKALAKYVKPRLLGIDEIGYLSYDSRHADLLFQVVHRRATEGGSTAITTNRPFSEWGHLFPNAASVTALIDRLVDRCDVVEIDGPSYREKRFKERLAKKESNRKEKPSTKSPK